MKTKSLISSLLVILSISLKAQLDLGITGMPTASAFHYENINPQKNSIYPVNFGLNVNYNYHKFTFSTGVLHLTQGVRFDLDNASEENRNGSETYDLFDRNRSVVLPLLVNYNILQGESYSFFAGTGLYMGYMYSQEQENTAYPEDWQPDPTKTYPLSVGRFVENEIFDPFFVGINFGIGWTQKLTEKLIFQLRPNFLYHLRETSANNPYGIRLMTWSLDIGFYYRLEKK